MWHEQSCPDRDKYVKILEKNIEPNDLFNFMKRTDYDVDSLGTRYDLVYASIMHYDLFIHAKNSSLSTMNVINNEEYIHQGKPLVGLVTTLSKSDIFLLNRLYNCLRRGHLKVTIKEAQNLKSSSPQFHVVVKVTAYDDTGASKIIITRPIENNPIPQWNQELDFDSRVSW